MRMRPQISSPRYFPEKQMSSREDKPRHAKTQTAKTTCRYRKVKSLNTENYFIIEHLVNNLYLCVFEIVNFAFIQ